jgi:uncharacterized membrane protein YhiD involved in acid resistance
MFDFSTIQYNTENPTFVTILLTIICSFVLSSLIAFTYEKTSRDVASPSNYIQALVLIAIVAAMVMQAIGDSLARGLGMLGALAIIRFRTTLRSPRNIVFMFASIATGIACGISGFVIAFVGTVSFCIVAVILRFTSFSQANNLIGKLTFQLPKGETIDLIEPIFKQYCDNYLLKNYRIITNGKKEGRTEYEYHIKIKSLENSTALVSTLQESPNVKGVELHFEDMDLLI